MGKKKISKKGEQPMKVHGLFVDKGVDEKEDFIGRHGEELALLILSKAKVTLEPKGFLSFYLILKKNSFLAYFL